MPDIPGKGKHGHVRNRGQTAARNATPYHIERYRGPPRGCGIFMFDTFPAYSALLYRKIHNPTKERTLQKGPALFSHQGELPQPAACPSFSEIRK